MLITSFKTFIDGVSEHAKDFEVGEAISVSGDVARLPFDALRVRERSMPNVIYRLNVGGEHRLGDVAVEADDFVLTCQGSAMAERPHEEWFYGDRTPGRVGGARAPRFCPGYKMADALIGMMSVFVLSGHHGITNLRRVDDSGTRFECDWTAAYEAVERAKKAAAAASGSTLGGGGATG